MELTYPNEHTPLPVTFRLRLASGWQPRPHATAAACAVDSRSPKEFAVNLVVLVTRVLADTSLAELVRAIHESPQTSGLDPSVQGPTPDRIGGYDALLSVLTFTKELPLFQAQAAVLVPRGGQARDLVHLYATCPAAVAKQYATAFRAMFATLTIGA
ncbi:hypothetical protein [Phytohabitans suffuscus]|nr:hypothetical protein [Phytohabitans suffuscus]